MKVKVKDPTERPVLRLASKSETEDAQRICDLIDEMLRLASHERDPDRAAAEGVEAWRRRSPGSTARMCQVVSMMINSHARSAQWHDQDGKPVTRLTASSRIAEQRLQALRTLLGKGTDQMGYAALGALVGMTKGGVQTLFNRADPNRREARQQVRITAKDAETLAAAKAAARDAATAPPVRPSAPTSSLDRPNSPEVARVVGDEPQRSAAEALMAGLRTR